MNSVRMMPQMMINTDHNQGPNGNIRLIPGQGEATSTIGNHNRFSSGTNNVVNNNPLYTSDSINSGVRSGSPSSIMASNISNGNHHHHSLEYHHIAHDVAQGGYDNNSLPIDASTIDDIGGNPLEHTITSPNISNAIASHSREYNIAHNVAQGGCDNSLGPMDGTGMNGYPDSSVASPNLANVIGFAHNFVQGGYGNSALFGSIDAALHAAPRMNGPGESPDSAVTSSNISNTSHPREYNIAHNVAQSGYDSNSLASAMNGLGLGSSPPRRGSYDGQRGPGNAFRGGMFSSFDGNQFPQHLSGNQFPQHLTGNQFPQHLTGNQFPQQLSGNQFPQHLTGKSGQFYAHLNNPFAVPPGPGPIGLLPPNQNLTPPLPTMNGNNSSMNGLGLSSSPPRHGSYDGQRGPGNAFRGGVFSSFDGNQFPQHLSGNQFPQHLTGKNGQFYPHLNSPFAVPTGPGPIGLLPPNQNLTPPLSTMNGNNTSMNINVMGTNRMMSAAPGAEAKYTVRNGSMNGGVLPPNNSGGYVNRALPRK